MQQKETEDFTPPPKELLWKVIWPLRKYFSPVVFGLENVDPKNPSLFVGNHTLYGVFDATIYHVLLYREKGIFLRSLGDFAHFFVPGWGTFLKKFGVVHGTRENCSHLMQNRENILVFPGGGREVMKRKDERYRLIWKERFGFVIMAVEHGYPILPVASVGADNAFTILIDAKEIMNSFAGELIRKSSPLMALSRNGDVIPPISRGLGLTPIPRPERFYFCFGKPISTKEYQGNTNDTEALSHLRDKVASSIYSMMEKLLHFREQDTETGWLRKVLTRL